MINTTPGTINYATEGDTDPESVDHQGGHEYVPMNVFIGPSAMKKHFQGVVMGQAAAAGN